MLLLSDQVKGVSGGVNVCKLLPFNVCTCEPVFSCLLVMYINRTRVWKETSAVALKAQRCSNVRNHKQNEETHFCIACAFFPSRSLLSSQGLRTKVLKWTNWTRVEVQQCVQMMTFAHVVNQLSALKIKTCRNFSISVVATRQINVKVQNVKDKFPQQWRFSLYLYSLSRMKRQVKFRTPRNISAALQHSSKQLKELRTQKNQNKNHKNASFSARPA